MMHALIFSRVSDSALLMLVDFLSNLVHPNGTRVSHMALKQSIFPSASPPRATFIYGFTVSGFNLPVLPSVVHLDLTRYLSSHTNIGSLI